MVSEIVTTQLLYPTNRLPIHSTNNASKSVCNPLWCFKRYVIGYPVIWIIEDSFQVVSKLGDVDDGPWLEVRKETSFPFVVACQVPASNNI